MDKTIEKIHAIEDVEELRSLASAYLIELRDMRTVFLALNDRVSAIERRLRDVDVRTRGMVRLG